MMPTRNSQNIKSIKYLQNIKQTDIFVGQNINNMANMTEKQRWQAQDDAYTMARYQEIMADKARASRAVKFVSNQANQMKLFKTNPF